MKKLFVLIVSFVACTAFAQNMFWSFDDEQNPMTIAPECDARFDEIRGGVFMPSTDEVYQYGLVFLENQSEEIRRQAPYCFLVAALDGHADAQFKLAQLYNKGDILPQDDPSAYKWAFIAALNGHKDAEKFALSLEPFLTTKELEATGSEINTARLQIQEKMKAKLETLKRTTEAMKTGDDKKKDSKEGTDFDVVKPSGGHAPLPTSVTNIFTKEDRFE